MKLLYVVILKSFGIIYAHLIYFGKDKIFGRQTPNGNWHLWNQHIFQQE